MEDVLKFRFDYPTGDSEGTPVSPTFYVNEEKGTVVCKLQGVLTGFSGDFENRLVEVHENTNVFFEDSFAIMEFTGKAKCFPGDKFDEKLGRQIAESRAKMKVYRTLYRLAYKAAEYYNQQVRRALDNAERYREILHIETERTDKLAGIENLTD